MAINYDALMAASLSDIPISYNEKDVTLYALGVGFGANPQDPRELPYVFEQRGPHTVPTFASMLVPDSFLADSGCDPRQILHRTQSLELYRPLPPAANLLANQSVIGVTDRGADKGAEIEIESELRRARDDTVICSLTSRLIARGDGGLVVRRRSCVSDTRFPIGIQILFVICRPDPTRRFCFACRAT